MGTASTLVGRPHGAAGGDALLIVDMISAWDFEDAGQLLPAALRLAPRVESLARRCRRHGVPVVYVNDNRGDWRSDFRHLVEQSLGAGDAARTITQCLMPQPEDYFVLKPRHSAFDATPLHLLLQHLGVRRVLLCGTTTDQCVLFSAHDARMHGYEVVVASDACATLDAARQQRALRHFSEVQRIATPRARSVRLGR